MRILIIDHEVILARSIKNYLQSWYVSDLVHSGQTGLYQASLYDYALIILEIHLPDMTGLHVCQQLRQDKIDSPVLMLARNKQNCDKIKGLDAGADDCLSKPFQWPELGARIRALLRRPRPWCPTQLNINQLILNSQTQAVTYQHQPIKLTRREFMLLELFMRHPNQVLPKALIIDHVWDNPEIWNSNTLEVHVNRLRQKIDRRFQLNLIQTVRGLGYKLQAK